MKWFVVDCDYALGIRLEDGTEYRTSGIIYEVGSNALAN